MTADVVCRWRGSKGQGLSLVSARIHVSKYKKRFPPPGYDVVLDKLSWGGPRGADLYGVLVLSKGDCAL